MIWKLLIINKSGALLCGDLLCGDLFHGETDPVHQEQGQDKIIICSAFTCMAKSNINFKLVARPGCDLNTISFDAIA